MTRILLRTLTMPTPDLATALMLVTLLWVGLRHRWTGRLLGLLLLSPALNYGFTVFGFELRLALSAWAGQLLQLAELPVQVSGNMLTTNGIEMAVDPACAGLHLTGVSLAVAVLAVIWHERRARKSLSLPVLAGFGAVSFGLTVLCNLLRIMVLVAFRLGPGTPAHEAVGLVCVVVYAWLPMYVLAGWLVRFLGEPVPEKIPATTPVSRFRRWQPLLTGVLLLGVGAGIMAYTARTNFTQSAENKQLAFDPGARFVHENLPNGFIKFSNADTLIYVKPLPDWWSAEHSPAVCWRGSGYEIRHIRPATINGHPAYVAGLHKPGQTALQTAWWFTNGRHITIRQLDFRGQMLRGEPEFVLVNVTTKR